MKKNEMKKVLTLSTYLKIDNVLMSKIKGGQCTFKSDCKCLRCKGPDHVGNF